MTCFINKSDSRTMISVITAMPGELKTKPMNILPSHTSLYQTPLYILHPQSIITPPPPNPSPHPSHLVDKPLVQLFSGVQHESLPLRTFLALRHQCGVLIPLKQTWNLEQQQSVSVEKSNLIVYVKLCNGCNVSILPCF